jgi:tricarboxylate carrier
MSPPFDLVKPRYNENTFIGRTLKFIDNTTYDLVLATTSDVENARSLLAEYKVGKRRPETTDDELWRARKIVEGCIHPDTGEIMFPLFRFAGFAPVNYFIIPVMLHPAVVASAKYTTMIHVFNQSFNSAVNFSNRNASNPTPVSKLLAALGLAVGSSVSIALFATKMVNIAAKRGGQAALLVRSTLPFVAVAAAGNLNVMFMRNTEWTNGVDLMDEEGTVHGQSVNAGRTGLMKCVLTRILWNIPSMTVAPLAVARLERMKLFQKSRVARGLMQIAVFGAAIRYGVPPSLAVFPQRDRICVKKTWTQLELEPQFHNLKTKSGKPIECFYYNKGL